MTKSIYKLIACVALSVLSAAPLSAQLRARPSSVNVDAQGVTTAVITWSGVQGTMAEALFCGELVSGQRCAPGSVFGQLPARYEQVSGVVGTITDIMTVPASVARRAYQDAAAGRNSAFYYVRRFRSEIGGDVYAAVTLRLTNGGAHTPFALTDVRVMFLPEQPIQYVANGEAPSEVQALIRYNGSGRLAGRWEVVYPGEEPPTDRELRTEFPSSNNDEIAPRRFTQLSRFNVFLPPTGQVVIPGPDASRMPTATDGQYFLLLRIESVFDGESPTEGGTINIGPEVILNGSSGYAGGAAPFPLPALRYIVGSGRDAGSVTRAAGAVRLRLPAPDAVVSANALRFVWSAFAEAVQYRVELGTPDGETVFSAMLPGMTRQYNAPPWLAARLTQPVLRWRVIALNARGREVGRSVWSKFQIQR